MKHKPPSGGFPPLLDKNETTTKTMNHKTFSHVLATAASRAETVGMEPASGKQCWFLAKLLLDDGDDGSDWVLDTSRILTKKQASTRISELVGK